MDTVKENVKSDNTVIVDVATLDSLVTLGTTKEGNEVTLKISTLTLTSFIVGAVIACLIGFLPFLAVIGLTMAYRRFTKKETDPETIVLTA